MKARLTRFVTAGGVRIYRLPVRTFPGLVNNVYLILDGPHVSLFDVGSGLGHSRADLTRAFREVRERFGEAVDLLDVQHAVVSHGHIDHFGDVGFFAGREGCAVYAHDLDVRVIERFEDRIGEVGVALETFLTAAGLDPGTRNELRALHGAAKQFFKSAPCDVRLRDGDRIVDGYVVHHTPGHCPGQVCLQVDDVLLTGDHVLARITPHQSPASITAACGLSTYLASLGRTRSVTGVKLALPGHGQEISDLHARIDAIAAHHEARLAEVVDCCRSPVPLTAIATDLFGPRAGYDLILALEEAGAHVEYLLERGELAATNGVDGRAAVLYETRRAGF